MSDKPLNEKYLSYRGKLSGIASLGTSVAFVTTHPENSATALCRLAGESLELTEEPLPCGGGALIVDGDRIWIAGTDGKIYESGGKAKSPKPLKPTFDPPATGLALLSNDRLAVLSGSSVGIVDRNKGELLQSLSLPEAGVALTSDPTGHWLAVGTQKGNISVFECEEKPEFLLSETAKLHEGAVTAMLFEPEELRFLSAGADLKLQLTHARGKLEAEDRGRGGMHTEAVTGIVHVPGDRFITGSRDGSCKNWARGDRTRPSTQTDGLVAVVGLTTLEIHGRTHLVAACHDDSLRIFLLDAAGKFGPATHKLYGALATAHHELQQSDARRREAALKQLASWNDGDSIGILSQWVQDRAETDPNVRRLAARLVAESDHPQSAKHLETLLNHSDDAVRMIAFDGLLRRQGPQQFDLIDQSLKLTHQNIAIAAVEALKSTAATDDRAHSRLVKALDHAQRDVAQAALLALEEVHGGKPEGDLLGLASKKHEPIRKLALVRLLQRKLLDQPRVLSTIRRNLEASDADVRHSALLVLILSRPVLATALRDRDADLNRQLMELESFRLESSTEAKLEGQAEGKKPETAKASEKKTAEKKPSSRAAKSKMEAELTADDLEPLLQATASRTLDSCVAGARYLALLKDARALGLLLQLSRDEDSAARVAVCKGLSELGDPRGVPRLESLLFDKADPVRDAAFSALAAIHQESPLAACVAGFSSDKEDVHRRALELLVRSLRKSPPEKAGDTGWDLMQRALNDSFPGVRKEALKSSLSLAIGGAQGGALRFVLKSAHADVRREVLTEGMAQARQPWAWELLLELFSDPDSSLRKEAFEFALKETKRKDLKPMEAGLKSQHADIRKLAIQELAKLHKPEANELIVTAINDEDRETRQAALEAVFDTGNRAAVTQALDSRHPDIRLAAAMSFARSGIESAFSPLMELAQQEQPPKGDPNLETWKKSVAQALDGLSDLGDPRGIDAALPKFASEFPELRKEAGNTLTWCAREEHGDLLCEKLKHEDAVVRAEVALGAAIQGRIEAKPFVTSSDFRSKMGPGLELIGLVMLGQQGENELVRLLDHNDEQLRQAALLFLLFREWKDHDGTPRRLLACLSSLMPRVRLAAAEAIRKFLDRDRFGTFVVDQFNDRGEKDRWTIDRETVETIAEMMQHGVPWIRARVACFIGELKPEKQNSLEGWWRLIRRRFKAEIERVQAVVKKSKPPKIAVTQNDLDQLAFGTYVGLVREQGSVQSKKQQASLGPAVIRIRQTAIARLLEMGQADESFRAAAIPVLIHALSDPNKDVRGTAFEALRDLRLDTARLASEAIETGFEDLGVLGLNLLTAGSSAAEGRKVLEEVMLTRTDALAVRAAELLRERDDPIRAAASALEGVNDRLRKLAVGWLAADFADDQAKAALQGALKSRFGEIREAAAIELARKKDALAFEALVEMLKQATNENQQTRLITAISDLGDPRGPAALLERSENDPTGTARHAFLLQTVGHFRNPDSTDRLLKTLEKKDRRHPALEALLRIAGYDQPIEDPLDEQADQSWIARQHPRHDAILARTMEKLLEIGESSSFGMLIPMARWAKSNTVDAALSTLCGLPDDDVRHAAVESVGWRFRKRNGPVGPLLKALEHKDPTTKFLAAEGLALGKRADGLSTLLASIELVDDINVRNRSVVALGELADPRALDVLLRLAGEDAHALQETAAEAIGHLGRSDKAEAIFQLLERFARGDNGLAIYAIRGLRWFNTVAGWNLVRDRARSGSRGVQLTAIDALGHNDDPATRALLLEALAEQGAFESFWASHRALDSARRLFGPDSLEPDYALLKQADQEADNELCQQSLKRVAAHPDPARILDVLAFCGETVESKLTTILLESEVPADVAASALGSVQPRQATAAAHLIGRTAQTSPAVAKSLESTLEGWLEKLRKHRETMTDDDFESDDAVAVIRRCVERMVWAAGRLGVAKKRLVEIVRDHSGDRLSRGIRRAAVAALGESKLPKDAREALAALGNDADPLIRQQATALLAAEDKKQAGSLAKHSLSDRTSFDQLAGTDGVDVGEAVREGVASAHALGIVLPWAIRQDESQRLAEVAANKELPDVVRLGAIEGLGQLATQKAERSLEDFGKQTDWDEELRKASWRALRRSKRRREEAKS